MTNNNNKTQMGIIASIKLLLSGAPQNREQIIQLLRNAENKNVLNKDTLEMIEGAFQVSKIQVKNIMIPRSHMVVVREDTTLQDMLPIIIDSAHSRFPVVGDSRDEVLGILLAKDLLRFFIDGKQEEFNLDDVLRPAVIVPESKRVNTLLSEFKDGRNHMAIVVDEYSSISGLVTIEDVLEQIVGEITDEHDIEEGRYIFEHSKGHFGIKALTPIEDFNEFFSTTYSDNDFETFGGLVLSKFGHLPKKGEKIEFDNFEIEVLRADKRRLHLLNVSHNP
ncbi:MAG: CBS domain-containing protein [Gammaproteobacteria bacterium]|nr:CBS domain-containing protein [Gammaproteobacteria bacterium]MDH3609022.1 CBS domain-containing protein [Gammaproteobacteria bacterium]NNC66822.1 CBS domain-containing protein [Gammaproteobacteria bacterium]